MKIVFWLAMMAMWSVAGQTVPQLPRERCVAEFRVYTHGMMRLPVESVKLDGVAKKPDGQDRLEVSCGQHRVEVWTGGYRGWAGEIEAVQPYQLFAHFAEMPRSEGGWNTVVVAVRIEDYDDAAGCGVVRLTPALEGGHSVTIDVSGRGGFAATLDRGPYLVALLGDGRICGHGVFVADGTLKMPVGLKLTPVRLKLPLMQ